MSRRHVDAATLYDALMSLTPEQSEAVHRIAKANPFYQGLRHASKHNENDIADMGRHIPNSTVVPTMLADVEPVMVIQALDLLDKFIHYRAKTCKHADPYIPMPLVGSAWKPGLITCHPCIRRHILPQDSPDNYRCDMCGYVVPTDGAADNLRVFAMPYGALMYQWGVCKNCWLINERRKEERDGAA